MQAPTSRSLAVVLLTAAWSNLNIQVSQAEYTAVKLELHSTASPSVAATASELPWQLTEPEVAPGTSRPQRTADYMSWLVGSYVAGPVLGLTATVLADRLSHNNGTVVGVTAVSSIAMAAFLPALVHWTHGDTLRGARALLAYPGTLLSGALVGAWLGSRLAHRNGTLGDIGSQLAGAWTGAAIGGVVGLATWTLFDLVETPTERVRSPGIQLSVIPQLGGALAAVAGRW